MITLTAHTPHTPHTLGVNKLLDDPDDFEEIEVVVERPKRLMLTKMLVASAWSEPLPTFELLLDTITTYKLMLEPLKDFAESNDLMVKPDDIDKDVVSVYSMG